MLTQTQLIEKIESIASDKSVDCATRVNSIHKLCTQHWEDERQQAIENLDKQYKELCRIGVDMISRMEELKNLKFNDNGQGTTS